MTSSNLCQKVYFLEKTQKKLNEEMVILSTQFKQRIDYLENLAYGENTKMLSASTLEPLDLQNSDLMENNNQ